MRRDDGFTLVEAIVALLILSLALTALFSAFSSSIERTRHAARHVLAVETARSLLQGAGIGTALAAGVKEGQSAEGLFWRLEAVRREGADVLEAEPALAGFWVTVTVGSDSARSGAAGTVTLSTLRLVTP